LLSLGIPTSGYAASPSPGPAPSFGPAVSPGLNWGLCPAEPELPAQPRPPADGLEVGSVSVQADTADVADQRVATFRGNAEVTRDKESAAADQLIYDKDTEVADGQGHVRLWNETFFWTGDKAHIDFKNSQGVFGTGSYRFLDRRGRGEAQKVNVDNAKRTVSFDDVFYTTCASNSRVWKLQANKLDIDRVTETGKAKHAKIKLFDVPVLYTPYMTFPIGNKRKSGLLQPKIGNSRRSGFDLTVPYYWNIAPNMDATFSPRYLSKRGLMLQGEFRYLMPYGHGQLNAQLLPEDGELKNEDSSLNETRYLVAFKHQQVLGSGWSTDINFNRVSDQRYFEDIGQNLSFASTLYLEQRADMNYYGKNWFFQTRVQGFQSASRSISSGSIYQRLPQFTFQTAFPQRNKAFNFQFRGEATYFNHDLNDRRPNGERIDFKPTLSYNYSTRAGFVIPRVSLRHTEYILSDTEDTQNKSQSRTVPIVSLDSGLFFDRSFKFRGKHYVQTLEPRLFYLYVPRVNQDSIPVFDTNVFNPSFAQLFFEDRFNGPDRIGDANQISLGLTSRWIEPDTGLERLRASIGQIYYIKKPQVTFPGGIVAIPGQNKGDSKLSDLVIDLAGQITRDWRLRGEFIWDPSTDEPFKTSANAYYRPGGNKVINFGYRFYRAGPLIGPRDINQTDVSFQWPITEALNVIGRWNHSLDDNKEVELMGGVEYESCCWGVRAMARRYLATVDGAYDSTFFVQLELKGLGGIGGGKIEKYLRTYLPGHVDEF
jgi:LPS-assembly protein